ncbi:S8/S53 family peptidase [Dyella koreensis]|uniref:Uncharacterized protein n=1 Tax=Dyella koreensis TaxID=311235 RepID=A0ABW8KAS9_9GAMM
MCRTACQLVIWVTLSLLAFPSAMGRPPVVNFDLSGVVADGHYDRFIIHFRESDKEHYSPAATVRYAKDVARRVGLIAPNHRSSAVRSPPLRINFQRMLATGGMLIVTSRQLDPVEAHTFIQALATYPAVAYVEPDLSLPMIDSASRSRVSWVLPGEKTQHIAHRITLECIDAMARTPSIREVSYTALEARPSSDHARHVGAARPNSRHASYRCSGYVSDLADAIVWVSGGHVDGMADTSHPVRRIYFGWRKAGTCSATSALGLAIARAKVNGSEVVVADQRVKDPPQPPSVVCPAVSASDEG